MSRRQRLTLLAAILGSAVATIDGSIVNIARRQKHTGWSATAGTTAGRAYPAITP